MTTTLIIGAGQAGARTAEELRERGYSDRIIVIGDERHAPYARPPLTKDVLLGKLADDTVLLRDAAFWKQAEVELILGSAVVEVDCKARTAALADGRTFSFDNLVLATGSRPRRLALFDDVPSCFYLRTLDDAVRLRAVLRPGAQVLIVGGGVIGLEIASVVVQAGGCATIVEASGQLMGRSVTSTIASYLRAEHVRLGVDIRLNTAVHSVSLESGTSVAVLSDGAHLKFDVAVIAIGVIPNQALAAQSGIAVGDGIIVDSHGRTSDPAVYAVGDVARHPIGDGTLRQETWRHAQNHPKTVAASILGQPEPYDDLPGFWSDQFEIRLQVEGTLAGTEVIRRNPSTGAFTIFYLGPDNRLVGAAAINDAKTLLISRRLITGGAQISATDLADAAFDLRTALRALAPA